MSMNIDPHCMTFDQLREHLKQSEDNALAMQELVIQGAINSISMLMTIGVTAENAAKILSSLKNNATLVREEWTRRGGDSLFASDQVVGSRPPSGTH